MKENGNSSRFALSGNLLAIVNRKFSFCWKFYSKFARVYTIIQSKKNIFPSIRTWILVFTKISSVLINFLHDSIIIQIIHIIFLLFCVALVEGKPTKFWIRIYIESQVQLFVQELFNFFLSSNLYSVFQKPFLCDDSILFNNSI